MHFSFLVACGLLTGAMAAPAPQKRHVVHERRAESPRNWRRENPLPPDSSLPMRFALTQNNLHNAEAYLMDVSNPSSPNFGKHWSAKQVAETFAPSAESINAVIKWLAEYGIKSERVKQSQSLSWVHANVTVAEAESLLNTKYYVSSINLHEIPLDAQLHVKCLIMSIPLASICNQAWLAVLRNCLQ